MRPLLTPAPGPAGPTSADNSELGRSVAYEKASGRGSLRPARAALAADGGAAALSLDLCTYDAPGPENSGEWWVQQTSVDDYVEMVAVEDPDEDLTRRIKRAQVAGAEGVEDVIDTLEARWSRNEIAARRARRGLKWKTLSLRADRLWTLTTRGGIETYERAWAEWGKFERAMSRRYRDFGYVVVLERHKSGNFHIHFATNGWMDVRTVRLLWHRVLTNNYSLREIIAGAASPGNVDVGVPRRSRKISGYLAKYLGKTFAGLHDQRIKRFASSKQIAPPVRRRSRMPASNGEHVYRLRRLCDDRGLRVESIFESTVAGRRVVWMQCTKVREKKPSQISLDAR